MFLSLSFSVLVSPTAFLLGLVSGTWVTAKRNDRMFFHCLLVIVALPLSVYLILTGGKGGTFLHSL